jgi:NhaP-type Na+/H+ or K+/H+ antiporter
MAELCQGYGFLAVFVCACSIRAAERDHAYHGVLHSFVEQLERLLTVVILILFGGAVARGLLDSVGLAEVGLAAALLLLVRPLTGWIALSGGGTGRRERWVIASFGVRGIGSLYYAAYALEEGTFAAGEQVWGVVGLVVVGSVVLHGLSATPVMAMLDRRRVEVGGERASTTPV